MAGFPLDHVETQTVNAGLKKIHATIQIVRRKEDSAKTVIQERVGCLTDNVETQTAVAG